MSCPAGFWRRSNVKLSIARDLLEQLKTERVITDYALSHFRTSPTAPPPTLPFATYLPQDLDPMSADNRVWFADTPVMVEFYTAVVDFQLMERFQTIVPGYWRMTAPAWLETENCFLTVYTI